MLALDEAMDKVFKLETTLSGELAELYQALLEEFEGKSAIPLAELNRTLLQTGMLHHLTMMQGVGLIQREKAERLQGIIDSIARETIMWDLVQLARKYWRNRGGGIINLKA